VVVLLALLAGVGFAAFNIAVRLGLAHVPDLAAASLVASGVAFVVAAGAAAPGLTASELRPGELWPFVLVGAVVPGATQVMIGYAIRDAGASRTAVVLGAGPLFSALLAIGFFHEPLRAGLAAGTVLVVAGAVLLAREPASDAALRPLGLALAVAVAALFGIRDNVVRLVGGETAAPPLVEVAVTLGAATVFVAAWMLTAGVRRAARRVRGAAPAFAAAGVCNGIGLVSLFTAFDRGRVTTVAPLAATAVLWTVLFAAVFVGRSEGIDRRVITAALVVVAGAVLVGLSR
jgi:uncharacterized membrane protein